MSWPTTLADHPEMMKAMTVHPEAFDATARTTMVWAPCCARRTAADTVVSLAGLETLISAGNFRPKADLEWACDGCLNLLIADRSNGWTWGNLFNALGAPDEVLRHYVAIEACKEAELAATKAGEWFNESEVYEQVYDALPADMGSDVATQLPSDATKKQA